MDLSLQAMATGYAKKISALAAPIVASLAHELQKTKQKELKGKLPEHYVTEGPGLLKRAKHLQAIWGTVLSGGSAPSGEDGKACVEELHNIETSTGSIQKSSKIAQEF